MSEPIGTRIKHSFGDFVVVDKIENTGANYTWDRGAFPCEHCGKVSRMLEISLLTDVLIMAPAAEYDAWKAGQGPLLRGNIVVTAFSTDGKRLRIDDPMVRASLIAAAPIDKELA